MTLQMTDQLFVEVQIELPAEAADVIAAVMGDRVGGFEIRDEGTLLSAPAGRCILVALVDPGDVDGVLADLEAALGTAREAALVVDPVNVRRRETHESEWRDVWKQFFRATRVGRRFIVRPSWDAGAIEQADCVIELDPGRAFGTGAHSSTRLALALAEDLADDLGNDLRDERATPGRVLDLGCGSGILTIAAALLWPRASTFAADVDPEATSCAEENLQRNRVTGVRVVTGSLADVPGGFDLVLANIQADVLEPMAPQLGTRLLPGGRVILSGILTEQADGVRAVYESCGFQPLARKDEGEWAAWLLAGPHRA
jgi:ribosomal protein L11 methyltransferase